MNFNKKGEVDAQIIKIVLVIAAFLIIIFLVIRFNFTKSVDDNICRASISLQSKGGIIGSIADDAFSANCKTNYVCISGGKKCQGITPTETIKVDASNKNEIMKAIADEMADCWWTYGEGKMNFAKPGWFNLGRLCAVCSKIVFDSEIQKKYPEGINYKEFYNFLLIAKKSSFETYSQYLYNTIYLENIQEAINGTTPEMEFPHIKNYLYNDKRVFRVINLTEPNYLIIASMKDRGFWPGLFNPAEGEIVYPTVLLGEGSLGEIRCEDGFITLPG